MNKVILLISSLILTSCLEQGGGSSGGSGGGSAPAPVETKSCASKLQRAWTNTSSHIVYKFYSNCTGEITSCGAKFDYVLGEFNNFGGSFSVIIRESTSSNICPTAGSSYACAFVYDYDHGHLEGITVSCTGEPAVYYLNSYGTE